MTIRDDLHRALSDHDPRDTDGAALAALASKALWASWLAGSKNSKHGPDPRAFHEMTGNAWARCRAQNGDDPRRAAQQYAREVFARILDAD